MDVGKIKRFLSPRDLCTLELEFLEEPSVLSALITRLENSFDVAASLAPLGWILDAFLVQQCLLERQVAHRIAGGHHVLQVNILHAKIPH